MALLVDSSRDSKVFMSSAIGWGCGSTAVRVLWELVGPNLATRDLGPDDERISPGRFSQGRFGHPVAGLLDPFRR